MNFNQSIHYYFRTKFEILVASGFTTFHIFLIKCCGIVLFLTFNKGVGIWISQSIWVFVFNYVFGFGIESQMRPTVALIQSIRFDLLENWSDVARRYSKVVWDVTRSNVHTPTHTHTHRWLLLSYACACTNFNWFSSPKFSESRV